MAGKPQLVEVRGPWKGLEFDASRETPQHDVVALNVDYHRGLKEPRPGFRVLAMTGITYPRLHASTALNGDRWLLVIGPATASSAVRLQILTPNGTKGGLPTSAWDLTAAFGEPYDLDWTCAFTDTTLGADRDGDGKIDTLYNVTLISTRSSTYVFNPSDPGGGLRRLSTAIIASGGDAIRAYVLNFAYMTTVPHGTITTSHQTRTFYAGLADGETVGLSNVLQSGQTFIPEQWLEQKSRQVLFVGRHFLLFSDFGSPADVNITGIIGLPGREPITALWSFQQNLVVFTETSIYELTGSGPIDYALVRVVNGTGCVGPNAVVEVHGVLYFMARDGVYAYGGLASGGAVKVSDPVDAIWTHQYDRLAVHNNIETTLGDMAWPPRAVGADLRRVEVLYLPHRKQLWWSLPVEGRPARSMAHTLVYDLVHRAWSVYALRQAVRAGGARTSGFVSGVVLDGRGTSVPLVLTVNTMEELQVFGHYRDGTPMVGAAVIGDPYAAGTPEWLAVVLVWWSGRLGKDSSVDGSWKNPRFSVLFNGRKTASLPLALLGGETGWYTATSEGSDQRDEIKTYPDGSAAIYLDGTKTYSQITYHSGDLFETRVEISANSPSVRVGVLESPSADQPTLVTVAGFSVEFDAEHWR